jgi:hypothetical protein
MRLITLPAALCLALAACQPIPQEAPYPGTPSPADLTKCGGGPIYALLGQNVAEMPASGGGATLRVIWPGMAVTEDYSETRLNVEVDKDGLIIGLTCG